MDIALLLVALSFGFYMAWNIGANDVANAMGTSVGSKALTLKQAVIIASILEFGGALLLGGHVSQTLQKGIVHPLLFQMEPLFFIYGMLAALLATGIWLQIASFFGWPVSTTHAIVGAIVGFGLASKGVDAINWKNVASIATSWIASPLLSGLFSYLIFSLLQKTILFHVKPLEAACKRAPYFIWAIISMLSLAVLLDALRSWQLSMAAPLAVGLALIAGLLSSYAAKLLIARFVPQQAKKLQRTTMPLNALILTKAIKHLQRVYLNSSGHFQKEAKELLDKTQDLYTEARLSLEITQAKHHYVEIEKIFGLLQVISACFVAFAHGANDVANAVGPLTAIFLFLKTGTLSGVYSTPLSILAFGGLGIIIGLASWGWRVIETIGQKITELTPTRGFSAEFGAATTIMIASKFGMPVSTTQSLVGALLGVGFARGMQAINLKVIRSIILSWLITIPVAALFSIFFYFFMVAIFS